MGLVVADWRENVVPQNPFQNGDVYEFGVLKGESMKNLVKYFKDGKVKIRKMFGFDSFEGLPKENKDKYNAKSWFEGNFNCKKDLGLDNLDDCVNHVKKYIGEQDYPIIMIKGYYNNILKDELIKTHDLQIASYIDIDCDQYTSTVEVLDFMFRNKLVKTGTLIGYDDWGGTPEWLGGESRAHKEMTEKYKINCELAHLYPTQLIVRPNGKKKIIGSKTIFRITSIM